MKFGYLPVKVAKLVNESEIKFSLSFHIDEGCRIAE